MIEEVSGDVSGEVSGEVSDEVSEVSGEMNQEVSEEVSGELLTWCNLLRGQLHRSTDFLINIIYLYICHVIVVCCMF